MNEVIVRVERLTTGEAVPVDDLYNQEADEVAYGMLEALSPKAAAASSNLLGGSPTRYR